MVTNDDRSIVAPAFLSSVSKLVRLFILLPKLNAAETKGSPIARAVVLGKGIEFNLSCNCPIVLFKL